MVIEDSFMKDTMDESSSDKSCRGICYCQTSTNHMQEKCSAAQNECQCGTIMHDCVVQRLIAGNYIKLLYCINVMKVQRVNLIYGDW